MTDVNSIELPTRISGNEATTLSSRDLFFDQPRTKHYSADDSSAEHRLNIGLRETMRLYRREDTGSSMVNEGTGPAATEPASDEVKTNGQMASQPEDSRSRSRAFAKTNSNSQSKESDKVSEPNESKLLSQSNSESNKPDDPESMVDAVWHGFMGDRFEVTVRSGDRRLVYDREPWVHRPSTNATLLFSRQLRLVQPGWGPAAVGAVGSLATAMDARHLYNARSPLEQGKYGAALIADTSMLTGSGLVMASKMPKLGPVLLLGGIAGRLATDFIPNRVDPISISKKNDFIEPKLVDEWALQNKDKKVPKAAVPETVDSKPSFGMFAGEIAEKISSSLIPGKVSTNLKPNEFVDSKSIDDWAHQTKRRRDLLNQQLRQPESAPK